MVSSRWLGGWAAAAQRVLSGVVGGVVGCTGSCWTSGDGVVFVGVVSWADASIASQSICSDSCVGVEGVVVGVTELCSACWPNRSW